MLVARDRDVVVGLEDGVPPVPWQAANVRPVTATTANLTAPTIQYAIPFDCRNPRKELVWVVRICHTLAG